MKLGGRETHQPRTLAHQSNVRMPRPLDLIIYRQAAGVSDLKIPRAPTLRVVKKIDDLVSIDGRETETHALRHAPRFRWHHFWS